MVRAYYQYQDDDGENILGAIKLSLAIATQGGFVGNEAVKGDAVLEMRKNIFEPRYIRYRYTPPGDNQISKHVKVPYFSTTVDAFINPDTFTYNDNDYTPTFRSDQRGIIFPLSGGDGFLRAADLNSASEKIYFDMKSPRVKVPVPPPEEKPIIFAQGKQDILINSLSAILEELKLEVSTPDEKIELVT